ncbi:hypothetical protein Tco_0701824 [Tanacetum coccineum]|uniref:DUF4283 domain-containing protein n=1 Tax=Tanacetum coccineum TaxID=301880 RepID=A0ABQ4XU98_9ASTR
MEQGFLSQKRSGGGRGVKEKNGVTPSIKEKIGVIPSVKDGVTPTIMIMSRTEGYEFSYFTYTWGNGFDVVVPVESIRAITERFANTTYGFFLGKRVAYLVFSSIKGFDAMLKNGPWFIRKNPLILEKWNPDVNLLKEDMGNVPVWVKLYGVPVTAFSEHGLSSIAIRLVLDDVDLKDNIVVAMPKPFGEGFYTCNVHVEYEWKPPRCAYCKVFGHVQDECPKNIDSDIVKNMKKPSQAPKGFSIGPKKDAEPTIKVSNSNPFDVLNSVENDVDLGTNGGTSSLASQKVNSSGSSFWNVESSSTSTTLIFEKIDKMERLIIDGKLTLLDDEGKPLKKVLQNMGTFSYMISYSLS